MAKDSTNNKNQFVDLDNARYDDQRQIMEEIIDAGHCPFCYENFGLYNEKAPIKEGTFWFLVKNKWPYVNTKQHFLLITKKHVVDFSELSEAACAELFTLSSWAIKEFSIPGGALAVRFGDTTFSAGSVQHLHAQLIQPDVHNPDFANHPVRLKIGKAQKK